MTIFQKAPAKFPRRRVQSAGPAGPVATAILFLVALCSLALANDPIFRVARVSLVEGEVSYQQANDSGKDWFDATLNLPLEENDQLYSGSDGRAEIQLSGRNVARIGRDTNLRFTQFNAGVIQIALPIGSAHFRIDSLDKRQFEVVDANDSSANDPVYFEVDTPTVAVTLVKEGVYRINVLDDGSTEVIVRKGQAEVYTQEIGSVIVKKGKRIVFEGRDDLYQITGLEDEDDWDRWNDNRDKGLFSRTDSSDSAQYIPDAIPGAYELDNYGEWIDTPEYGRMWSPRGVAADWAPYRDGDWRWFPSYGWTWISYEPWGWTPYHYGRWAYVRNRWCWAPFANINPGFGWRWRPHHVAFFGWGGSYNRGYRDGLQDGYWKGFRDGRYGYLGWCPLSPRDRHYAPRNNAHRLEALGNYHAPGGVRGMDARRFTSGRVAVSRDALNAPHPLRREIAAQRRIERGDERDESAPAFVRNEDLKPLQPIAATRSQAVARGRFARRIEAPVIFRRTRVDAGAAATHGSRPIRDGQVREGRARDGQTTPAPAGRGDDPNPSPPARNSNERIERPSRTPDYRRPDRVAAPSPRPKDVDRSQSERARERGDERENQRRDESPSRSERRSDDSPQRHDPPAWKRPERREEPQDSHRERRRDDPPRDNSPRRSDDAQRRFDPPAWRGAERREERHDSPPHRERRRDDPPSRDNSPHRETRRADPPSRAPERQHSPPPARENAPSRPAERPPERPKTRRPNIQ